MNIFHKSTALLKAVFLVSILLLICFYGVYLYILQYYGKYVFTSTSELEKQTVGVVLGAQVINNSVPSSALQKRLDAAIELYKDDKVQSLVMSGDGIDKFYNETKVMRNYAIESGVSSSDIVLDESGLRTYYSCYEAKNTLNLNNIVIISQADHVLRAVYICRRLGINAVGYVADEFIVPRASKIYFLYVLRERLALINAVLQLGVRP